MRRVKACLERKIVRSLLGIFILSCSIGIDQMPFSRSNSFHWAYLTALERVAVRIENSQAVRQFGATYTGR